LIGTLVMKYNRFRNWNTEIKAIWGGYYDAVGDTKLAKAIEEKGISAITKCVKVEQLAFVYLDFDNLPRLELYKITDDTVFYFREYNVDGKILGTDKIRSVSALKLIGFWGHTWIEFVDWIFKEFNLDINIKFPKERKRGRKKDNRRTKK